MVMLPKEPRVISEMMQWSQRLMAALRRMLFPVHGELSTHEAGMSAVVTAGVYTALTGWTLGQYTDDTDRITMDAANGTMTLGKLAQAVYDVLGTFSFAISLVAGSTVHFAVFKNGIKQNNLAIQTDFTVNGMYASATITGRLPLVKDDVLTVRVTASDDLTVSVDHANFNIGSRVWS